MSKPLLSKSLILAGVPTIIAFISFYISKIAVSNSVFGALTLQSDNFLFVMPTSILLSTLVGFFVFITLTSFLKGVVSKSPSELAELKSKPVLSRKLQVISLTVISIYASFTFQEEILKVTKHGVVGIDVLPDFTIIIPSVIIISIMLAALTFLLLAEFLSSLSQEVGFRNSQAIQKLTTGAFVKKEE